MRMVVFMSKVSKPSIDDDTTADENSHVMQCVMEACLHDEQQISLLGLKVYVNACVHLPQGESKCWIGGGWLVDSW